MPTLGPYARNSSAARTHTAVLVRVIPQTVIFLPRQKISDHVTVQPRDAAHKLHIVSPGAKRPGIGGEVFVYMRIFFINYMYSMGSFWMLDL